MGLIWRIRDTKRLKARYELISQDCLSVIKENAGLRRKNQLLETQNALSFRNGDLSFYAADLAEYIQRN